MELVIGGFAQGKTTYVMNQYRDWIWLDPAEVLEASAGDVPENAQREGSAEALGVISGEERAEIPGAAVGEGARRLAVLDGFHLKVRKLLETQTAEDADPGRWLEELLGRIEQAERRGIRVVVISDEVGSGVVPVDGFERDYREWVGRLLIRLAERAERVERVICGMGQRIK